MTAEIRAEIQRALRELPAVDEAVRAAERRGLGPRWAVLRAVREQVERLRERVLAGDLSATTLDDGELSARVAGLAAPSLRSVINATGVVLHTNLGRAPLAPEAAGRLVQVATGYSNLEYELGPGRRGSRHVHLAELLREVCGAQDAVVVNNNAAAVLLCLAAHAAGREVVVSRGELIEIGGSFRLPEVMQTSGARLREVGTTNRTHLSDYEQAIGERTALLLKVHRSNYAVVGFTAEVSPRQVVALGQRASVATMFDLGSGTLVDLRRYGLPAEPTVQEVVASGFDLVTFSGDKLLGGPQAGVICGRAAAVAMVRGHPLMRALRPDKLTVAALTATLQAYRDGEAEQRIPALRMLSTPAATLRQQAEDLAVQVHDALGDSRWQVEAVAVSSRVGGGAVPTGAPPSWAVALTHPEIGATTASQQLRAAEPPVVGRIDDDRLLLDVRTVAPDQLSVLARAVASALGQSAGRSR